MVEKIINGEKRYLSCSELVDGMSAERYAYLVRITRRVDVNRNPYLTFFLKTIDNVILVGHKFRVEENDSTGVNILTYNRMMVRVKFDVQVYNGSFTLLIRDISLLPREDATPFFDTFADVNKTFEHLAEIAVQMGVRPLDFTIKTASLFNVQYGKTGAYVELLDMVYHIVSARKTVHTSKLVKCLLSLSNQYFQYLRMIDKIDFLPKKEILALLQSTFVEDDDDLTSVVVDTLSALMKQSSPEHLYAHTLFNAFETAMRQIVMEESVKASPKNLVIKTEEGEKLIFY